MPPSIIYYIPPPGPSTAQSDQSLLRLQHNIRQNLRADALPRWTLEHRHFRETPSKPSSTPTSSSPPSKTLHCLTLSWKPGKTWIGIVDETGTPGTTTGAAAKTQINISSIPTTSLDEFWSLLALRLSPLWQPRGGGIVSVRDGVACRVADFVIRIGELKLVVPAAVAGTVPVSRGTVCQIVYGGGEIAGDVVGTVIRGVWEIVGEGVAGREVFRTREGDDDVEGWIEALKGRDGR